MRKLLLITTLLLAGCATRPAAPPPAPSPAQPTLRAPQPVASPAEYVASASARSLLLVRASELAEVRVRALAAEARRVAAAHGGIAAQLSFAGRRLDLLPTATLGREEQAALLAVRNADDVGAAWRRLVREQLARCERDGSDFAERGASPTLRPMARFALGVCREELARRR